MKKYAKPAQRSRSKHLVLIVFVALALIGLFVHFSKKQGMVSDLKNLLSLPNCPETLQGLVTHPIMDKGVIRGLVPLGNSNPPGHTFPVDHIYFHGEPDGVKHNVYAAGDGVITEVTMIKSYGLDGKLKSTGLTVTIDYCKGVQLVNAIEGEPATIITNVIASQQENCKRVPGKHEGELSIDFCGYQVSIPVKASDVVAVTDGKVFPEIWALDKNKPLSKDVAWVRYDSPYYQYAFCFFDMYPQDLKDYYYTLFGNYIDSTRVQEKNIGEGQKEVIKAGLVPRTIPPLCGKVMQNIVGTAKGDWFGEGRTDKGNVENENDLALIEDNLDPRYQRVVIGGNIAEPSLLNFRVEHSGVINRDFAEVKADGKTYCYEPGTDSGSAGGWWKGGKIVLRLVDSHNLLIEKQEGSCTGNEQLQSPKKYDR
jgi:hypothetical protein